MPVLKHRVLSETCELMGSETRKVERFFRALLFIGLVNAAVPLESSEMVQWMRQQSFPRGAPYFLGFDGEQMMNITTLIGGTTLLPCRVRFLGDRSVSWIRHKDVHILSAGNEIFVRDGRFHLLRNTENAFPGGPYAIVGATGELERTDPEEEWSLRIENTMEQDGGLYECQVNTVPIRSRFVNLSVAVPTAMMLGKSERFVDQGSTINLTCVVVNSPTPPEALTWMHNGKVISPHNLPRGGMTIMTEKNSNYSVTYLLMKNARPRDSGTYSCRPSNAPAVNISVHVLDGDYSAAMYSSVERIEQVSVLQYCLGILVSVASPLLEFQSFTRSRLSAG